MPVAKHGALRDRAVVRPMCEYHEISWRQILLLHLQLEACATCCASTVAHKEQQLIASCNLATSNIEIHYVFNSNVWIHARLRHVNGTLRQLSC